MNGGNRMPTISQAEASPADRPTARPMAALALSDQSAWTKKYPVTTLVSPMTAPGARSIPPVMITMAAPMAAMP
jgi:hypothetical protein